MPGSIRNHPYHFLSTVTRVGFCPRPWIIMWFLSTAAAVIAFVGEPWSHWTPFSTPGVEDSIIQVRYRLESFGGMGGVWEWEFRNASANRAAFRWRVDFSDGTKLSLSATLGPGEIGSGWSCDVRQKCPGQPRPVFAGFIGTPATPVGPNRVPGGLVYATCDDKPDDLEHDCNVGKLNCNKNADAWCRAQKTKPFEQCYTEHTAKCEASRTKCIQRIRQCPMGKHCKYGTCE